MKMQKECYLENRIEDFKIREKEIKKMNANKKKERLKSYQIDEKV